MKRIFKITILLVMTIMIGIIPVMADTAERQKADGEYVTVSDITNEDTLHNAGTVPTVSISVQKSGEKKDVAQVTYSAAELKIIGGDRDRPDGFAWLGVRLTPKETNGKTYTHYKIDNGNVEQLSDNNGKSLDYYFPVSKANLTSAVKEGKDLIFTKAITWLTSETDPDPDATVTTLTVTIKAEGIQLFAKNNTTSEWNKTDYDNIVAEREAASAPATGDTTPKTGKINVLPILATIALITLFGIVLINNRKK